MTRTKFWLLGLFVFSAACSNSTTQPSQAAPNTFIFTATMLPSNEVPAIGNTESVARGTATITFVVTRDSASAIAAATVTYSVSLTAFPAGSNKHAGQLLFQRALDVESRRRDAGPTGESQLGSGVADQGDVA